MTDKPTDLERAVVRDALRWLAKNGHHAPYCRKNHEYITPDGAYYSGLCKDYGGRYKTKEELDQTSCTCGLDRILEQGQR